MIKRPARIAASSLVAALALLVGPELLWPTPFVDLKIKSELTALEILSNASRRYRQERGATAASVEQLHAEKYMPALDTHDWWGHRRVYRPQENGDLQIYSVGLNGKDEGGGGDDVILEPKRYRCGDYAINCARSLADWAKLATVVVAAGALLVLLVEAARWMMAHMRRSWDAAGR